MSTELDNSKLIVNYLPHSLSDEGFKAMFSKIGLLENCKLMKTPDGRSLAYGFVEYKSPDHGLQAITKYNGVEKDGKKMKVSIAKPKGSHGSTRKTTTLYIADLPDEATETTVREVFEKFGQIVDCEMVVNSETGLSKGFAFLQFLKTTEANAAIKSLNGTTFPGTSKQITVRIKDEPRSTNPDIFVANVPKNMSEETLKSFFDPYGAVRNCKIVLDTSTNAPKGIAFVKFSTRKESEDSIAGLNDTRLPGSTKNLVVRFKFQKEDKSQEDQYEMHDTFSSWGGMARAAGMRGMPVGLPRGMRAMPVGMPSPILPAHIPDPEDYTTEEIKTYPNGQVKRIVHHYVHASEPEPEAYYPERQNGAGPMRRGRGGNRYNPAAATIRPPPPHTAPIGPPPPSPHMVARHPAPLPYPPRAYAPNPYPPNAYPTNPHPPIPYSDLYSLEAARKQPSHGLYVSNLGPDDNKESLYELFAPFGAVTKVFPMRDPSSDQCKGFGFVEMPDEDAAVAAIQALNGMPYKEKFLKVDFKTEKK